MKVFIVNHGFTITSLNTNNSAMIIDFFLVSNTHKLRESVNRATQVFNQCRPSIAVEHLIIYNLEGLDEASAEAMMIDSQRILSGIPGLREVFCGKAVKADASYCYSWLIHFCHPAVIGSYR